MASERFIRVFIPGIIAVFLCTCKPTDIVLHGEISGKVTDFSTGDPVDSATVKLNQSRDSTDSDGNYLLKNLVPGTSEIQITRSGYTEFKKNITVVSGEPKSEDFPLIGIPVPYFSPRYLDFGLDSTRLSFTISNKHSGKFSYAISNSTDWIHINPLLGDIKNDTETDTITVTIDRAGSDSIHTNFKVIQYNDQGFLSTATISVYVNGVLDDDKNFYKIVKIGAQTWMAENLIVGIQRISSLDQLPNNIIEYYDYGNNGSYKIYGGLYQWGEMMNYMPPDNKLIGTTRGICPVGWHIPTDNEWQTLNITLGVVESGGKMKETGFAHWERPNTGATNESGFSGLPGGLYGYYYGDSLSREFNFQRTVGVWWTSSQFLPTNPDQRFAWQLHSDQETFVRDTWTYPILQGCSVRCVKDQP